MDLCNVGEITMNEQLLARKLELVKAEIGEVTYQTIEFINTGYEKDVVILDKTNVISFYRDGFHFDTYHARQELIRRLGKHAEIVLPESLYVSHTEDFVIENYVPGYRITPQYVEENKKNAKQIGRLVGRFLRQLHTVPEQGLNLHTRFEQDVRNDMEQGLSLLETKLSRIEMNQIMEFLSMYYEISGSTQTCIVHGDFHYDNVLWDEEAGRLGVIDFSEGGIEDPALDFMYMCYYPEEFRREVFDEYGSIEKNLYERSKVYNRIYGLYDMVETLQNNPRKPDFQKGYSRFFDRE